MQAGVREFTRKVLEGSVVMTYLQLRVNTDA